MWWSRSYLASGFVDSIREARWINTQANRQTLLFSATYGGWYWSIVLDSKYPPLRSKLKKTLNKYRTFLRSQWNKDKCENTIKQRCKHFEPRQAIVFCNTKVESTNRCRLVSRAQSRGSSIMGPWAKDKWSSIVRLVTKVSLCLVATRV